MIIVCKPRPITGPSEQHYEITVDGRLLSDSVRDPLTDGARILLAEGVDPAEPLILRHAGSDMDCLRSTVGKAAALVVEGSSPTHPMRFRKAHFRRPLEAVAMRAGATSEPAPVSDSLETLEPTP